MERLAEVFKALGDPTRLKIVKMLAENGEMCVCRFVDELGMGQSAVSHHMASLRHAGLVLARRQGQWIYYRLDPAMLDGGPFAFLQAVRAELSERAGESSCC